MSNSPGYRGNPTLFGLRARLVARQEEAFAAALATLAEAEAEAAEAIPEALTAAGVIVPPARRRPSKAPKAASEQE